MEKQIKTYAIAWTEFFDNNITVEFYKAKTPFGAVKACWKAHRIDGVKDEELLKKLQEVLDNFKTIEDIMRDFFDCDENISEPVPIENY